MDHEQLKPQVQREKQLTATLKFATTRLEAATQTPFLTGRYVGRFCRP